MKRLALALFLCLPAMAQPVDPNDFADQQNDLWALRLQVAKLQATEDANQAWLKGIGGAVVTIAGLAVKLLVGKKDS